MFRVRRLWWIVAGVGSMALLSACSATSNDGTASEKSGQTVQSSNEMGGIHNLLLTDAGLLMGTHNGLWLQDGEQPPSRVGTSRFDVMGLAKISGGLVASGHPGEGDEQVGNLGLRISSDAGLSWKNISLYGKVDFHRLTTSGKTILGISSHDGALLRSDNSGKTWTSLSNPNIYDLAMNPHDPSMIVGSTENGPILSSDGGKTFKAITSAPLIAFLSWDKARLVGVAPDGLVYESLDMAITWRKIGSVPGQPQALSVRGNEIAILTETELYYSSDAGLNFIKRITGISGH